MELSKKSPSETKLLPSKELFAPAVLGIQSSFYENERDSTAPDQICELKVSQKPTSFV